MSISEPEKAVAMTHPERAAAILRDGIHVTGNLVPEVDVPDFTVLDAVEGRARSP